MAMGALTLRRADVGAELATADARALFTRMADCLFEAMQGRSPGASTADLPRLDPLSHRGPIDEITFSGGVSE